MKQLLIMVAMVALGIAIYNLITGPSDDSIKSVVEDVWKQQVVIRTDQP